MKTIIFFLLSCFSIPVLCQQYAAELVAYQQQYKKDLAEIIHSDTAYVRFFTPDARFRVTARVETLRGQPVFSMATSGAITKQARKALRITFRLKEKKYSLFGYQLLNLIIQPDHKDHFFIPFYDETSGSSTYGGGRYLDFELTDIKDDTLKIDFNKAYNPYCAFVTGYNCPVPPAENALPVAVAAGERNFGKSKEH